MFSGKSKEAFPLRKDIASSFHPFNMTKKMFLTYVKELIFLK